MDAVSVDLNRRPGRLHFPSHVRQDVISNSETLTLVTRLCIAGHQCPPPCPPVTTPLVMGDHPPVVTGDHRKPLEEGLLI